MKLKIVGMYVCDNLLVLFSACHYLHNASFIEKKNKSKNLIFPLKLKQDLINLL